MKKLTLLLGLFLAFMLQAQAQTQKIRGGIKAGVNTTTWGGDAAQSFSEALNSSGSLKTKIKTGYHVGGFLHIPVTPYFSLEPGLYYSTKGMTVEQTFAQNSFLKVRADITNESHYLDLPLLAKVELGKGFQLFAGPQVSYLIANKVRGEAGVFGFTMEQDIDWKTGLREFDFGLTGGLGYQFVNGILMNVAYDHGLTSLDAGKSNFDIYNRAVKFSVGYRFK